MRALVGVKITCRSDDCYNKCRARYVPLSSVGRAHPIQGWGRRFESYKEQGEKELSSDNRPAFLGVRIIQWWDKVAMDVTVCCDLTLSQIPTKGIYWYICCSDLVQSPTTVTGRVAACVERNLWSSVYGAWYEVWKTLVLCVILLLVYDFGKPHASDSIGVPIPRETGRCLVGATQKVVMLRSIPHLPVDEKSIYAIYRGYLQLKAKVDWTCGLK